MSDNYSNKTSPADGESPARQEFYLMAKPVGPACNLRCTYCFYREKQVFFPESRNTRMSEAVLEAYIRKFITAQPGPEVSFEWQGGEPTLAGLDFFRRAVELQSKYGQGSKITNSLQTNGTLLDDEWCAFLAANHFLVGLSLDGPPELHDAFRVDAGGGTTSGRVISAFHRLCRHGAEVNILACVNRETSRYPLEVYRFFRDEGVRFIQFIPIVEREPGPGAKNPGLHLAGPDEESGNVTSWSVEPEAYGEFLVRIFEEWVQNDVGQTFVMNFEWALGLFAGAGPGVCYLAPRCGRNLILEHNGDVFSCDHFMYPQYRLGNILRDNLPDMVESSFQTRFGRAKEKTLPNVCRACEYLFACRGGCPKHRFASTFDNESGLNYLCPAFKIFYQAVAPIMESMIELLRKGIPVRQIMDTKKKIWKDIGVRPPKSQRL